jgi:hypothetical protein
LTLATVLLLLLAHGAAMPGMAHDTVPAGPRAPVANATVHGTVRAEGSLEPISRATVQLPQLGRGVLADERGYFVLTGIPEGRWRVRVSALGFRSVEQEVRVPGGGAHRLDLALTTQPVELSEIEVRSPGRREETLLDAGAGPRAVRVTSSVIRAMPALAEVDVLRAVQALPSVAAISDFSSALYIRGGSPDQALVTLDGVPVFNPYHLGGLFAAIDPDAVSEVEVLPGAFPARVGDRLAGAVAIRTRDGGRDRVRGNGAVGLISSRASLDGPAPGGRGSYLVTARRTYLDLFTDAAYRLNLIDTTVPYAFSDAYLKLTHEVGRHGGLTASVYLNDEGLGFPRSMREEMDADLRFGWGTRLAALSYRHLLRPTLVAEARAAATEFYGDFRISERPWNGGWPEPGEPFVEVVTAHSRARDALVGGDLTWYARRHELRVGAQLDAYRFAHGLDAQQGEITEFFPRFEREDLATTFAAYVEDVWSPTQTLSLRGGLRLLHAGERGTAWMPRLGARWAVSRTVALAVGAGRYAQVMHSMRNEESLAASLLAYDFLIAAAPGAGLPTADDVALGIEWASEATSVRLDAYAKRFTNLPLPAVPDDMMTAPVLVPNDLHIGAGSARGLELLAQHGRGQASYTLAYTLAFATREVEGERFAARFERRHTADLMTSFPLGRNGQGGVRLVMATGQPYTEVLGLARFDLYDPGRKIFIPGRGTVLVGEHNAARLPGYLRLDVGARRSYQRRWFRKDMTLTPYLQVLNALNTRNVLTAYPSTTPFGPPVLNYAPQLPIFPTAGLEWQF